MYGIVLAILLFKKSIGFDPMKMFGTVFFICTCFFLLFVMVASTPLERINRTCLPANWIGKVVTSTGATFSSRAETHAEATSNKLYDTCRFFVFRQFYADKLEQLRKEAGSPAGVSADKGGK